MITTPFKIMRWPENVHSQPLLSVLICTIPTRKVEFQTLIAQLEGQRAKLQFPDEVEIIACEDSKQMSIGEKRNLLLDESNGEYITFIDDDDWVHVEYLQKIVHAIKEASPDCIGYKIACTFRDINKRITSQEIAKVSNIYTDWHFNKDGFNYAQMIYHKNPVRREIVMKARFPDKRHGEDYDYGKRIKPYLKTEYFIDEFMYYYRFTEEPGGKNKRYNIK